MPYELKLVPGGYFVKTQGTERVHSKGPLTKEKAEAQMKALYAKAHQESYKHRPTREKFIQEVVNSPSFHRGAFTAQAVQRGLTARQFKEEVLAHPERYDITTRRRAQFVSNIGL